ncbi:MAG: O-antigen ligase family protein [Ktedonobacteraceae bacterium]|nr:O-antigen ligase family protein [Ktedonobacteraceae bacterium]
MPPAIAALLTCAVIIFLFRRDSKQTSNITGALWIPLLWMLIISSRFVTDWLDLFGLHLGATSLEEGSPVDATVSFLLIASGLYVLHQRRVRLTEVMRHNQWLTIFLLYCLASIIWSDFQLVALKRWIKVLGHPIMALVVLTELYPKQALIRLMKRCGFVVIPVSILFLKYYPQWGRGFDSWTGAAVNMGITTNKNALGCDCMLLGFFFFWYLIQAWKMPKSRVRREELLLSAGFLFMIWWLLSMAHSSTSLVSLLIGVSMVLFVGLRIVNKRFIGTYLVAGVLCVIVAEATFGVYAHTLQLLGKDPTLTDRTLLWHDLLNMDINPIFGTGFESFWLGDRLQKLWATRWWHPNEAHNGYLETYINLGLLGLFLLLGTLIATFWKSRRELLRNFEFGRFRLGLLIAIIFYNWTEASFKALSLVWFVFYLIALDYPQPEFHSTDELEFADPEDQEALVGTMPSVS